MSDALNLYQFAFGGEESLYVFGTSIRDALENFKRNEMKIAEEEGVELPLDWEPNDPSMIVLMTDTNSIIS